MAPGIRALPVSDPRPYKKKNGQRDPTGPTGPIDSNLVLYLFYYFIIYYGFLVDIVASCMVRHICLKRHNKQKGKRQWHIN